MVLVGWSLWTMAKKSEEVSLKQIAIWFAIILVLHVIGVLLAILLPLLVAVMFDAGDRSLTYFTNNWLVLGLYICPAVIGLVLPLTLYYTLMPNVSEWALCVYTFISINFQRQLSHAYQVQMSLHAHLVLLTTTVFIATALGFRSEYSCLISLIFYSGALLINLLSKLHDKGKSFWGVWGVFVMDTILISLACQASVGLW